MTTFDSMHSMERMEMEAVWGLSRSHPRGNQHCNACRALEIIITITRQARGLPVEHPVDLGALPEGDERIGQTNAKDRAKPAEKGG